MKAVFEVEFNPDFMADEEQVERLGGWFNMIEWLYKEERLGIFENELELIEVKE